MKLNEGMTSIVFSDSLARVLAAFILATGAASLGMKPTMFLLSGD